LLELEDAGEDERKELHGKIESLESIVRMLELKSKNSSDHGIIPVAVHIVSVLTHCGQVTRILVIGVFCFTTVKDR
jgi:hypothetical protein